MGRKRRTHARRQASLRQPSSCEFDQEPDANRLDGEQSRDRASRKPGARRGAHPICATVDLMARPRVSRMTLAVLTLASLFAGHELTYVLAHGLGDSYAQAMTVGGHDDYWMTFVLVVGTLVITSAAIVYRQFRRLAAVAQQGSVVADADVRSLLLLTRRIWIRVSVLTVALFLFQENYELWNAGADVPLLGVVSGDHWMAVPILLLASSVLSVIGALVGWRRLLLEARARRTVTWTSAQRVARRRLAHDRRRPIHALVAHGLRAPPTGSLTPAI